MPIDENETTVETSETVVTAAFDPIAELKAIRESIAPLCLDDLSTQSKIAKAVDRVVAVLVAGR